MIYMNRLWEYIILPIFKKINPKYIIEIGSENGINTENILEYCILNQSKLTSIDPLPLFDQKKYKKKYGNHFEIINDLSLNCLGNLDNYDIILIDGDHNWYTVYNELKIIEKKFDNDNFPTILIHDVDWPYARRDLYYNPDTIPKKYLHPYAKMGIYPGQNKLMKNSGLNKDLNNALYEKTPQNGVLTAIEDFLKETDLKLCFNVVHAFHGLGIITTEKNYSKIKEITKTDLSQYLEKKYLEEIIFFKDDINKKIYELNKIREENETQQKEIWKSL